MRLLLVTAAFTVAALGSGAWAVRAGGLEAGDTTASAGKRDPATLPSWSDARPGLPAVGAPGEVERVSAKSRKGVRGSRCGRARCGGGHCGTGARAGGQQESDEGRSTGESGLDGGAWSCGCVRFIHPESAAGGSPRGRAPPSQPEGVDDRPEDELTLLMTGDSARIAGFAVDAQTGAGLAGLDVQLERQGEAALHTQTDAGGAFEFAGLAAGSYALSCPGLGQEALTSAAPLELSVGQLVTDLVLDVAPLAAPGPPRSAR